MEVYNKLDILGGKYVKSSESPQNQARFLKRGTEIFGLKYAK